MRPVYAVSGGVSKFAKARPDRGQGTGGLLCSQELDAESSPVRENRGREMGFHEASIEVLDFIGGEVVTLALQEPLDFSG